MRAIRSPVRAALAAACFALAGCHDTPLAPDPAAEPQATAHVLTGAGSLAPDGAGAAVRDVVDRVLPALGPAGATAEIRATLLQALAHLEAGDATGAWRALGEADHALALYGQQAGAALAPDIAAVRLALDLLSSFPSHHPVESRR